MTRPFFTIGHSTRTIAEFVDLLETYNVNFIIDVRTVPKSRTNPQYNKDSLPTTLSNFQIGYEHIASLGGLRGRAPDVAADLNGFWKNKSFHQYADYALSEPFQAGLARLREIGRRSTCAVMCAEAVWWRCHRRIIADYLINANEVVLHLMGSNKADPAHMTSGALPRSDGRLTYPAIEPKGSNNTVSK